MKRLHRQKGFTLVELAIVLTIIGLLIGGILKGQQLIANARVTAQLAQVQGIDAATTTFRDTYGVLPGDMAKPNTRLSGFVNTVDIANIATLGSGTIGAPAYVWAATASQESVAGVALPAADARSEPALFFGELAAAGLISGINYNGALLAAGAMGFGTTSPTAKVGSGGIVIGTMDGVAGHVPQMSTAFTTPSPLSGLVLVLEPGPNAPLTTATGTNPVSAATAAQIDRKMDDGAANTGSVEAFGWTAAALPSGTGCATIAGAYNETSSAHDCGLMFRIQQ